MLIRHALAMTAAALVATPAPAQDTRPKDDAARPAQFDTENDEVLQTIRAAVAPTKTQWDVILSLYKDLRAGQAEVTRQMRSARGSGREKGDRAQDAPDDREARRAARRRMNEKMEGVNRTFLADCRALMTEEQLESWDACAADLDLRPQGRRGGRGGLDRNAGPQVGDVAPVFEIKDLAGRPITLESLRGKPVVIEFGSYTCPIFRRKVDKIEQLRHQFGDRVHWVMVYTKEAHPLDGRVADRNVREGIEIPQHTSYEQRLQCARQARQKLGLNLHVLVDGLDNEVTDTYGGFPNRGYVLDAEGRVVSRQVWIEADQTRVAIQKALAGGG